VVLVGAVPLLMLKTPHNPDGTPRDVFDSNLAVMQWRVFCASVATADARVSLQ
jgi:hypothetical protein